MAYELASDAYYGLGVVTSYLYIKMELHIQHTVGFKHHLSSDEVYITLFMS